MGRSHQAPACRDRTLANELSRGLPGVAQCAAYGVARRAGPDSMCQTLAAYACMWVPSDGSSALHSCASRVHKRLHAIVGQRALLAWYSSVLGLQRLHMLVANACAWCRRTRLCNTPPLSRVTLSFTRAAGRSWHSHGIGRSALMNIYQRGCASTAKAHKAPSSPRMRAHMLFVQASTRRASARVTASQQRASPPDVQHSVAASRRRLVM